MPLKRKTGKCCAGVHCKFPRHQLITDHVCVTCNKIVHIMCGVVTENGEDYECKKCIISSQAKKTSRIRRAPVISNLTSAQPPPISTPTNSSNSSSSSSTAPVPGVPIVDEEPEASKEETAPEEDPIKNANLEDVLLSSTACNPIAVN